MSEMKRDMTWAGPDGGSGCTNPGCDATDRWVRVLSKPEVEAVYESSGQRESLPVDWPLPEDCTHVCTSCGWMYFGMMNLEFNRAEHDVPALPFEFEPDDDATPGANVRAMIDAAPDGTTIDELEIVARRTIRGAGRTLVEAHLDDDDDDVVRVPAASYM